ncbi:MAG TPA: hypothetical protein VLV30_03800 [Methanomicrobiales archaeon]|nr:hypothetical protein [Methanomicrobiales archaeon]
MKTGPACARYLLPAVLLAVALLAVIAGCASNSQAPSGGPQGVPGQDQAAFIAAANDCADANLTVSEDVGTFRYTSRQGCIFTKTLVRLNASESQAMKTMLEGKSMTCGYAKGAFDPRLVTSLVGGMEYCTGDLKDAIAQLIVFT